jgi:hypothetical protein
MAPSEADSGHSGAPSPSSVPLSPAQAEGLARTGFYQAREALQVFCRTGNTQDVVAATGLTAFEVKKLQGTSWWREELVEVLRHQAAEENAALTRVFSTTLTQLEERLQKGDPQVLGNKIVRLPLSASVLARVADAVFKQRQLLRENPTEITVENGKLEALARKLRALGARDPALIDQEVPSAPYPGLHYDYRGEAEKRLDKVGPTRYELIN